MEVLDLSDGLMVQVQSGDAAAFDAIDRTWRNPLAGWFLSRGAQQHDVDSLVQDTLWLVFKNACKYTPGTCFKAWLFTIARNVMVSCARSTKRYRARTQSLEESMCSVRENDPAEAIDAAELSICLAQEVERLPSKLREACWVYLDGGSSVDCAHHANVGRNTARSRMRLAVRRLKEQMT